MMIRYSGTGFAPDDVAETEADCFGNCAVCGAYLDVRDLSQLLAHIHDQEIEIGEVWSLPASVPWIS
jgi:hypothetical protein